MNLPGLRFGAVNKANYTVKVYGAETRITDYFNGRLYNQQEGRPLLLPDGESIFVVYCARFYGNPLPPFTQVYSLFPFFPLTHPSIHIHIYTHLCTHRFYGSPLPPFTQVQLLTYRDRQSYNHTTIQSHTFKQTDT